MLETMSERAQDTLSITGLTVHAAGRTIVDDVSFNIPMGKIVALLGPNGAGKSELVLGLAGAMAAKGSVQLAGVELCGKDMQTIRAAGVAAVPEGHQTLAGLSVTDNLRAAGPHLSGTDLAVQVESVLEIFPELKPLLNRDAGQLSGGQQQMVALAQALVSRPKILLIDEMSLGLAPVIIERLVEVIRNLRNSGIGILLIEQFTQLALDVADECHVIAHGQLQFSGGSEELRQDRTVLERAYLGS